MQNVQMVKKLFSTNSEKLGFFAGLAQLSLGYTPAGQETWPVRMSETGNFSIRTRKKMIQVV